MAFNINVVNSCKYITIRASRYDPTATQATITVENMDTNTTYSTTMDYDGGTGRGLLNIPTENLSQKHGVFKVCINEGTPTPAACKPLLIKCDIDCCLTKLTDELIDCKCDCPKCASSLAKAQKVFLLLQSAQSAVEIAGNNVTNNGYYIDILEKYKKARSICDESCGCDC